MGSLLEGMIRRGRNRKKRRIHNGQILTFAFPGCHQVVVVGIFKDGGGGKNFSLHKILVLVKCLTHHQVQQEQQKQRVLDSGVPSDLREHQEGFPFSL